MYEFEEQRSNQGWWWMMQLLIAEKKSISQKTDYEDYCETIVTYLINTSVLLPQQITKRGKKNAR